MDVRTKDAVRRMEQKLDALILNMDSLRESATYLKKMSREIKESVTRKYNKK